MKFLDRRRRRTFCAVSAERSLSLLKWRATLPAVHRYHCLRNDWFVGIAIGNNEGTDTTDRLILAFPSVRRLSHRLNGVFGARFSACCPNLQSLAYQTRRRNTRKQIAERPDNLHSVDELWTDLWTICGCSNCWFAEVRERPSRNVFRRPQKGICGRVVTSIETHRGHPSG